MRDPEHNRKDNILPAVCLLIFCGGVAFVSAFADGHLGTALVTGLVTACLTIAALLAAP